MAQVEPIEVVLRLESSSKWPDELEAVRSTGTAFLIRLAQCLEKKVRFKVLSVSNVVSLRTVVIFGRQTTKQ